MTKPLSFSVAALVLVACAHFGSAAWAEKGPERWEPQIRAFEKADETSQPPSGGVLFIGSSSIRGWDVDRWFPELTAINRGFGGSQIEDSTYYADRIIFPYEPGVIVLYAGDNDIAAGKSPKRVLEDFKAFHRTVRGGLPHTPIIFVAIKPSLPDSPAGRWSLAPQMNLANAMIRSYIDRRELLLYADIFTPMLNDEGLPRADLFRGDGLHLNEAGYELWTDRMRPLIRRARELEAESRGPGAE